MTKTLNGIELIKGQSRGWWFNSERTIKFVPEFRGMTQTIIGYAAVRMSDNVTLAEGHTLSSVTRRLASVGGNGCLGQ